MIVTVRIYRPIDTIGWLLYGNILQARSLGHALNSFRRPPEARSVREWNLRLTRHKGTPKR